MLLNSCYSAIALQNFLDLQLWFPPLSWLPSMLWLWHASCILASLQPIELLRWYYANFYVFYCYLQFCIQIQLNFHTYIIDIYHIFQPLCDLRYMPPILSTIWYSRLLAFCHFLQSAVDNTDQRNFFYWFMYIFTGSPVLERCIYVTYTWITCK